MKLDSPPSPGRGKRAKRGDDREQLAPSESKRCKQGGPSECQVEKIMWVLDSMQDRYFRAPVLLDILETHVGYLKPGAPPDKVRRAANLSVFLGRRCQEGEHLWERRRDPGSKHGVKYMYHSKKSAQDPTEAGNIDAYKKVADAEEAAEAAKAAQAAQAAEAAERAISSGMLTQRLTSANTESKPMGWVMQHPNPRVAQGTSDSASSAVAAPAPTPAAPPPLSAMEAVVAATATQQSTLDGNADAEGFHMIAHGADGFTKVKDEAEEEIPAEMLTDEIPILGYFLLEDEVAIGEPRQTPPPTNASTRAAEPAELSDQFSDLSQLCPSSGQDTEHVAGPLHGPGQSAGSSCTCTAERGPEPDALCARARPLRSGHRMCGCGREHWQFRHGSGASS